MDVIQGQAIEMLVLLLPRATVHVTGLSHLPDGLFPAAMISNRVISTCRGREVWALILISRAIGTKERIRLVGSEYQGLHECLIEEVVYSIFSQFHFWAPHTNVGKVISEGPSNVHAPERNGYPVSSGGTVDYHPPLFIHFPEGGFDISVCSDDSLKRSGMRPVMKHLLVPHVQTISACMKALGGSKGSPAIYDVTLVEPNAPPLHKPFSWFEALCVALSCPLDLHAHVNCYSLTAVLDNSHWLENKWEEKDKIIAYFRRHNRFPDINSITGAPYIPSLPATIGAPPCKSIVLDTGTWQFCGNILSTILLVFISLAAPLLFLLFLPVALPVCVLEYVSGFMFSSWVIPG